MKLRLTIRSTNHKSHRRLVIPINDQLYDVLSGYRLDMTQRYSHASEDERHDAVRRFDRPRKEIQRGYNDGRSGTL